MWPDLSHFYIPFLLNIFLTSMCTSLLHQIPLPFPPSIYKQILVSPFTMNKQIKKCLLHKSTIISVIFVNSIYEYQVLHFDMWVTISKYCPLLRLRIPSWFCQKHLNRLKKKIYLNWLWLWLLNNMRLYWIFQNKYHLC